MNTRGHAKTLQLVTLLLVVMSVVFSISQLQVSANYCAGYSCSTSAECGSACGCNSRTGTCASFSELE